MLFSANLSFPMALTPHGSSAPFMSSSSAQPSDIIVSYGWCWYTSAEDQVHRTQIQNNAGHVFSGLLTSKNKPELEDIIITLGLASGTKADMIQHIQDYFKYHPEEAKSACYSDLFSSACCGRYAAPPPTTINEVEDPCSPFDGHPLLPNQDAGPSHTPAHIPPPLPQYPQYLHPPQLNLTPNPSIYTHTNYHMPYTYNT